MVKADPVEILYNKYYERMRAYAYRRLRSYEDADDVVQPVFMNCLRYTDDLLDADNVGGYLMQMVKNEISAVVGKRERESTVEELANSQVSLEDEVIQSETVEAIYTAIDKIKHSRYRQAATLYYKGGLDHLEIALQRNDSMHVACDPLFIANQDCSITNFDKEKQ